LRYPPPRFLGHRNEGRAQFPNPYKNADRLVISQDDSSQTSYSLISTTPFMDSSSTHTA
jgi:hypothetical protein